MRPLRPAESSPRDGTGCSAVVCGRAVAATPKPVSTATAVAAVATIGATLAIAVAMGIPTLLPTTIALTTLVIDAKDAHAPMLAVEPTQRSAEAAEEHSTSGEDSCQHDQRHLRWHRGRGW